MNIELIDLHKYPAYSNLLPFIEAMKDFDINTAINKLKENIVKDTDDIREEYWFHIVNNSEDTGYYTNYNYESEDPSDDNPLVGDWKYIKIQTSKMDISDTVKELFNSYKHHLTNFPYEVEIHSIKQGMRIEDHIDKPDIPVNASSNRNLVVSLHYPTNFSPDQIGIHIDRKAFTPEAAPVFLFDSQYLHGAWNNTDEPWTFLVFYIPTVDIEGECFSQIK